MFNISHQTDLRKIALASYHNYYHSKSMPPSIAKQTSKLETMDHIKNSTSQLNFDHSVNDENKVVTSKPAKKRFWDRSISKDG